LRPDGPEVALAHDAELLVVADAPHGYPVRGAGSGFRFGGQGFGVQGQGLGFGVRGIARVSADVRKLSLIQAKGRGCGKSGKSKKRDTSPF